MANLGSFNAAVREFDPDTERDTFDLFGVTFTVEGVIPPMLMVHLGAAMVGKAGQWETNAALWQALRCSLSIPERPGEDGTTLAEDDTQFRLFYRVAVAKRADHDTLLELVFALVGAQAGKVTEQPPTSPGGPPPTSESSNSSSSDSPALRSVEDLAAGLS